MRLGLSVLAMMCAALLHLLPTNLHASEELNGGAESMTSSADNEALERKDRSMARLKSEGVPTIDHLPTIESEADFEPRSLEEVAYRAMSLLVVALKGEGLEQLTVDQLVEKYRLTEHFSPAENAFLADVSPSDHDRIQFSWRYEAACTLLWALGYIETLGKPDTVCDVAGAVTMLHERTAEQFVADAKLRPVSEILDEADLIYRYHWAVVDARINGREAPAGLDPGVTLERHYTLNWLIRYMDQDWDDISTDT